MTHICQNRSRVRKFDKKIEAEKKKIANTIIENRYKEMRVGGGRVFESNTIKLIEKIAIVKIFLINRRVV